MEPIYEYLKNIDFGLFVSENAHVFIKTINIDNKRVSLRICLYHETDMANWYIYMYYGFWEENKKVIYSHVEDIDTDCIDYDAIETMINTDIHNTID